MRFKKLLSMVCLVGLGMTTLASCSENQGDQTSNQTSQNQTGNKGTIYISCAGEDMDWTKTTVETYLKDNNLDYTVSMLNIGDDVVDSTVKDWSSTTSPDIYTFASDKNTPLLAANALGAVPSDLVEKLKSEQSEGAVANASSNNTVYSYPYTNNGYFLFYSISKVNDARETLTDLPEDVNEFTMDDWLAVAEATKSSIYYPLVTAFYGAGAITTTGGSWNVEYDRQGKVSKVTSDFADKALELSKAINAWHRNSYFIDESTNGQVAPTTSSNVLACVNGPWALNKAQDGSNSSYDSKDIGYAVLPRWKEGGEHIHSFYGTKNWGVNPMKSAGNADRLRTLHDIAYYLASPEVQIARYEHNKSFTPTATTAINSEEVSSDEAFKTFVAQTEYGVPQANLPANIWTAPQTFIQGLKDNTFNTNDTILEALRTLDASLAAVN